MCPKLAGITMRQTRTGAWFLFLAALMASSHADARHSRHHHSSEPGFAGRFAGPEAWSNYVSNETGTSVEYPANIFSVKEAPTDQHGQMLFRTADNRGKLIVYSLPNNERETPRSYLARHLVFDRSLLTYQRIAPAFFAISGVKDDLTFYSRCNFKDVNGRMHCIYLEYPKQEERAWDAIVTRISRSLSGPSLPDQER
jgi:hypothetical protein